MSTDATAGVENMHITDLIQVGAGNDMSTEIYADTFGVQDDIMVDIVVLEEADRVVMSIEFSTEVLDGATAKQMLEDWAALVRGTLGEGGKNVLGCECM